MNTTKVIAVILLSLAMFNCTRLEEPSPQSFKTALTDPNQVLGEWRYIGEFSHLADYKCIVCSDFNYEASLYAFKMTDNTSIAGRINKVGFSAKYSASIEGKFTLSNLRYFNLPNLTEIDAWFVEKAQAATNFGVSKDYDITYDVLTITYGNGNNFLAFARKK